MKEDLRIIATFMFVLLLIIYGFVMLMGFISYGNADFRTPSVNPVNKAGFIDSDFDSLPSDIASEPKMNDVANKFQSFADSPIFLVTEKFAG